MKLSIVLLAASMLQAQVKDIGLDVECYAKVDCKLLNFVKEAIESGKGAECESKGAIADAVKCQLEAFGLNKGQAELAWKITPYANQCNPKIGTEFKTCTVGCTKQKDRDACLESCVLPPKIKAEECLEKSAGMSTENASKNAKCMVGCDKDTYAEIFDCQYKCHKDVLDALAGKDSGKKEDSKDSDKLDGDSDHKSTGGASKTSSSGSQTKPTGSSQSQSGRSSESSAYLTTQVSSLAKVSLTILISLFLFNAI